VVGTEVGADPVSDSALQPALWPLEPPLLHRRTTTDLAMDTTGPDIIHRGLMPIMADQSTTALGTIAGARLLTGKGKGPVHPGPFLGLRCEQPVSRGDSPHRVGEPGKIYSTHMLRVDVWANALITDFCAASHQLGVASTDIC
jgi:hypothetical protein